MSCSLILGAMFTGKSTELLRSIKVEVDTNARALIINSEKDGRCGKDEVSTHNTLNNVKGDGIRKLKLARLDHFTEIDDYDVIGIDEGHWFPDINETVRHWVLQLGKTVIIAALTGDFNLELIGDTYKLLPICAAGQITILGGRCLQCLRNGRPRGECIGSFSYLRKEERVKAAAKGTNTVVGGKELFETLCLSCHLTANKKD
jgi:thymidine kinase